MFFVMFLECHSLSAAVPESQNLVEFGDSQDFHLPKWWGIKPNTGNKCFYSLMTMNASKARDFLGSGQAAPKEHGTHWRGTTHFSIQPELT